MAVKIGEEKKESNHDLIECETCAWNEGKGYKDCRVYTDKRDVILDDEGRCYSRADKKKRKEIERNYKLYEGEC